MWARSAKCARVSRSRLVRRDRAENAYRSGALSLEGRINVRRKRAKAICCLKFYLLLPFSVSSSGTNPNFIDPWILGRDLCCYLQSQAKKGLACRATRIKWIFLLDSGTTAHLGRGDFPLSKRPNAAVGLAERCLLSVLCSIAIQSPRTFNLSLSSLTYGQAIAASDRFCEVMP